MPGFGAIGPKSERQRIRGHRRPPGGGGEKSLSSVWVGLSRPGTALYSLDRPTQERIIDLPRRWGLFCPQGRVLVTHDICTGFASYPVLCYTVFEPIVKGRRRYQRPGPVGNLIPAGHHA